MEDNKDKINTGWVDSDGRELYVGDKVSLYKMMYKCCTRKAGRRKSNHKFPIYRVLIPEKHTGVVVVNKTTPIDASKHPGAEGIDLESLRPKAKYYIELDDGEMYKYDTSERIDFPKEYFERENFENYSHLEANMDNYLKVIKIN